jgi:pimeloyl-ACP methyl ester carboxylesterase
MQVLPVLALALVPLAGALGAQMSEQRPAPVRVPDLEWVDCGDGFECATAEVPLDYDQPRRESIELALIRRPAPDPAQRIGTLFVNPGGPGGSGVNFLRGAPEQAFAALAGFDVVSWDPRGVGASVPDAACGPSTDGPVEFHRPDTVDPAQLVADADAFVASCVAASGEILAHLSSANSARDLDLLRRAVGDERLNYVGVSYGSMIGAAYATLFPGRTGAIVLDSPVDVEEWTARPIDVIREQLTGFENTLDRLFAACAGAGTACPPGSHDPEATFDDILARLDREPLETGDPDHPFPVTGDEVRDLAASAMYDPTTWHAFAAAAAAVGDGDPAPLVTFGATYGSRLVRDTGALIQFVDARWPRSIEPYLDAGRRAFRMFDHFWFGTGYDDVAAARWPVKDRDALRGEVEHDSGALPILVVASTYDPATPYAGAEELVRDLGNARLLTFRGNGHPALQSFDPCLWGATLDYLYAGALPADGATCVDSRAPFG